MYFRIGLCVSLLFSHPCALQCEYCVNVSVKKGDVNEYDLRDEINVEM